MIIVASSEYGATRYIRGFLDEADQKGKGLDFCYFGSPELANILGVESQGEVVDDIDYGHVELIVTGTGIGNTIDKKMWRAASANGVHSRALVDHWSVYPERFKDANGNSFFPSSIGLLDDNAKALARLAGYPMERCFVAGNPRFLSLAGNVQHEIRTERVSRVCFLHEDIEPDLRLDRTLPKNMSFFDLFDAFCYEAQQAKLEIDIKIRSHPASANRLSALAPLDESPDLETLASSYDVFIGIETMLLVELMLAGAFCVSCYHPLNNSALYLGRVPLLYSNNATEIVNLISTLQENGQITRPQDDDRSKIKQTWLEQYYEKQASKPINVFEV